jgi:hypothetical protein
MCESLCDSRIDGVIGRGRNGKIRLMFGSERRDGVEISRVELSRVDCN